MRALSVVLVVLPFLATVTALCNVTGRNAPAPTNLLDLRTPTPYTWTLSAEITGCATAPQTITLYDTWLINGTQFPAQNTATVTFSNDGTVFVTFTFPQMTVTSLTPGQPITLLDQSANQVVYHVPQGAIPYSATSTSSIPSTSTAFRTTTIDPTKLPVTSTSALPPSPGPASSGSSTPTTGIIAGSVVGGIAVVSIVAFAIYKLAQHKKSAVPQDHDDDYYAAYPEGVDQAQQPGLGNHPGMQETRYMRQSLKYPDEDVGGVSANLRQEI